jgi:PadR family transcriptional regulator, regulatory protein PadR
MDNAIVRDVFLAFVRVHILHHAARDRVFGLEMIEELRRHGYKLSPGTLYPILHGLEESGLLTSSGKVVGGKMRKYYKATAKGRRMLAEVRGKISELVGEILDE